MALRKKMKAHWWEALSMDSSFHGNDSERRDMNRRAGRRPAMSKQDNRQVGEKPFMHKAERRSALRDAVVYTSAVQFLLRWRDGAREQTHG